jgi:hypothetical protein
MSFSILDWIHAAGVDDLNVLSVSVYLKKIKISLSHLDKTSREFDYFVFQP